MDRVTASDAVGPGSIPGCPTKKIPRKYCIFNEFTESGGTLN